MPQHGNSGGCLIYLIQVDREAEYGKALMVERPGRNLKNGLPPKPFGRVALALAPSAPENLLAIVESSNTGLYISADGGETWKQQSATLNVVSRPFYFSTLVVDPFDPKRVYRPAYSFSYSTDGGYSFAMLPAMAVGFTVITMHCGSIQRIAATCGWELMAEFTSVSIKENTWMFNGGLS